MKLLFLLPSMPEPADAGARIRNRGLLSVAAADHEVHVLTFGEPAQVDGLSSLALTVEVVPAPPTRGGVQRAMGAARSHLPDLAERLWSAEFDERLRRRLARDDVDVVQAEGIEMARYLALTPRDHSPWRVYDAHNAEFLLQRRAAHSAPGHLASLYSRLQWRRLERFERQVVRDSRLTLAVSEHDANQLEALSLVQPGTVQVVPNGIDIERYVFRTPHDSDPADLLFIGKLDYRPNAEAVGWLLDAVLPRLHRRLPEARLFVVGSAPPSWLVKRGQNDPRIAVVGGVPDERPYLARAAALALPLQVAGGSRLKALVAMASGVPIVSTRLGMEGIRATAGADYLRADTAEEWAATLAQLVCDPGRRRQLAEAGRAVVEKSYTWRAIAPQLRAAYDALLGARPA